MLTAEYEAAKAAAAGKKLRERLLTAKPLQEEIGELQQKLEALPKVTAAEVKALEQLQNEVNTKETELQGMKLLAQLSVKTPQTISVSSPLAQPETACHH